MPGKEPFSYITGLSYGPVLGETSRATNYGPFGNRLGTYDVAASPDIRAAHPYGSTFTYGGKTYTINDASYAGGPTVNTLEFRDTPNNQRINPADIQWNNPGFFRFDQNASSSPFEWYPKEGGMLGKIASHLPGVTTYLAGQSVFDFIRSGLGKLFGPGGQQQAGNAQPAGNAAGMIPDNLQPTSPGYSFAPGFGAPSDPNAPAPFAPPPSRPEFGGAGFGNYAQAQNAFIPGLINWNGPGATNPTGREPGLFENAGAGWLARHPIGQGWWNLGAGGRGPGAAGIMPGRQK